MNNSMLIICLSIMERVPAVAVTGVDVISVGALTHSVRSIDLGLDWN